MLIATGRLTRQSLADQVAIVTGAGGGIGFEAARALAWLGARVIVAEVNGHMGKTAAEAITRELGAGAAVFIHTDVGDARSVEQLAQEATRLFGKVDIVLNNATFARLGAVKDVSIQDWDASYRVNLRGPVLLARAFLPGMLARNYGVFVCVSSTGAAYMGAYETFKAAQVHLANTLDAELESTGVVAFTIGPGLVPTPTAQAGVAQLASMLGMSAEEFWTMNAGAVISVEEAGAGFAAAIALAEQFRGQETLSLQALKTAGIPLPDKRAPGNGQAAKTGRIEQALTLCRSVRATLVEQSEGWKGRSLFERQWVIRDFKKTAGWPAEQWLEVLGQLQRHLEQDDLSAVRALAAPLDKLAGYYKHLGELAKGYEKDPVELAESLRHVNAWQAEAEQLHKEIAHADG
jgi:NAD(P)-dependent dehydrogenase (short-subunit alcohol dehydrogenase family)